MPRTLVLIKPDGVGKNLVGKVLDRFLQAGLQLVGLKMLRLSQGEAERFYGEHQGKPFYESLMGFMMSAPIVASVWQGDQAIEKVRALMGATDSQKALAGTLRRDFGTDNRRNLVHGSDSAASAEREIAFFFRKDELFDYNADDWQEILKGTEHGQSKKTSHSSPAR